MSSNATVGTLPPPPGVVPNFDDPPSLAPASTALNIAFAVFSTCFVALRFYTTLVITRARGFSDFLLALAWLLAIAFTVTECILPRYGFGRHLWDVPFATFNINFMKLGAVSGTFWGMSLTFSKLAILAFYARFAWGPAAKHQRVAIYTLAVIVSLYGTVTSFEWVFACQPIDKYWDLTITGGVCVDFLKFVAFNGVMNTITDAAILLFPIWMLQNLRVPLRQKIGIMGIMMTGGLVLAVSIARLVMAVDSMGRPDITWEMMPLSYAMAVEMHVGLVCVCLVSTKPFFRRHFPKLLGSSYATQSATYGGRSRRRTTQSGAHGYTLPSRDGDAIPLGDTSGKSPSETAIVDGASTKATEEEQGTAAWAHGPLP